MAALVLWLLLRRLETLLFCTIVSLICEVEEPWYWEVSWRSPFFSCGLPDSWPLTLVWICLLNFWRALCFVSNSTFSCDMSSLRLTARWRSFIAVKKRSILLQSSSSSASTSSLSWECTPELADWPVLWPSPNAGPGPETSWAERPTWPPRAVLVFFYLY